MTRQTRSQKESWISYLAVESTEAPGALSARSISFIQLCQHGSNYFGGAGVAGDDIQDSLEMFDKRRKPLRFFQAAIFGHAKECDVKLVGALRISSEALHLGNRVRVEVKNKTKWSTF